MSSEPLEDIAKGATKGALEWTADFIKQIAKNFQENKLRFISDKENIEITKEQYNSGELQIYKAYIEDKAKLMVLRMGLVLRRLENKGEKERKQTLREDIMKKYEIKGLHVAQFVENGILNRYIGILLDDIGSIEKFKERINEIIDNIEKYVIFVKSTDNDRLVLETCLKITTANLSMIFIVSGIGSAAQIVKNIEERLKELLKESYELEKMSKGDKENLFFKRILNKE